MPLEIQVILVVLFALGGLALGMALVNYFRK